MMLKRIFTVTLAALLISANAFAQSANPLKGLGNFKNPQNYSGYLMIGAMILMMYFLIFRPQRQQMKARQDLLGSLKVGDKVITSGGIYGEITEIKEKSVRVKIAKDVVLRMDRSGIQGKTIKSDE